jgi:hypothetical protein
MCGRVARVSPPLPHGLFKQSSTFTSLKGVTFRVSSQHMRSPSSPVFVCTAGQLLRCWPCWVGTPPILASCLPCLQAQPTFNHLCALFHLAPQANSAVVALLSHIPSP